VQELHCGLAIGATSAPRSFYHVNERTVRRPVAKSDVEPGRRFLGEKAIRVFARFAFKITGSQRVFLYFPDSRTLSSLEGRVSGTVEADTLGGQCSKCPQALKSMPCRDSTSARRTLRRTKTLAGHCLLSGINNIYHFGGHSRTPFRPLSASHETLF